MQNMTFLFLLFSKSIWKVDQIIQMIYTINFVLF